MNFEMEISAVQLQGEGVLHEEQHRYCPNHLVVELERAKRLPEELQSERLGLSLAVPYGRRHQLPGLGCVHPCGRRLQHQGIEQEARASEELGSERHLCAKDRKLHLGMHPDWPRQH